MNHLRDRDPLTMRFARTLRDTERDAYAWWEPPRAIEPQRRQLGFIRSIARAMRKLMNRT